MSEDTRIRKHVFIRPAVLAWLSNIAEREERSLGFVIEEIVMGKRPPMIKRRPGHSG